MCRKRLLYPDSEGALTLLSSEPRLSGSVRCCQVICRAVGQLSGIVRCLCQTSCQVLSVLSGDVGCVSDSRGAL